MPRNQLITASIGLYHDANDMYYLQIITAQQENNYLVNIGRSEALSISDADHVEIAEVGDNLSHHPNLIGEPIPSR